MPHYYQHKKPQLPQTPWPSHNNNNDIGGSGGGSSSSSSGMNVSIILDQHTQPGSVSFTNLDQVSGFVVVRCPKDVSVDNITVKLEGESRTRLLSPASTGEKQRPQLEYHKILYKVAMVFPSNENTRERLHFGAGKNATTLPAGSHEFPFDFKLPFNNSCVHEMTKSPSMSVSGSGIEIAKPPPAHVKKTLPPTLSGFPGEAEIRYYLKATVSRHYFWQESLRAIVPFNFFPIEPPRPAALNTELYARQTHAFNQLVEVESTKSRVRAFFSPRSSEPSASGTAAQSPTITVDARLPEPAILTCNEDIPLRILVKKTNDFVGMLYLQSLQVALVGTTKIRAHEAYRTESSDWIIMSKSNMGVAIGAASDPAGTEAVIDDRLWRGQILPNTVAPSFVTCNIARSYHLDVRVGLSYNDATQGTAKVRTGQIPRLPQTVVLPLKLDLEVYSGIAPPQQLLDAMAEAAEAKINLRRHSTTGSSGSAQRRKSSAFNAASPQAETSGVGVHTDTSAPTGIHRKPVAQPPPSYADAPPSYEDAIGSQLPPLDGSRPQYVPPSGEEDDLLRGDEKSRLMRRDS